MADTASASLHALAKALGLSPDEPAFAERALQAVRKLQQQSSSPQLPQQGQQQAQNVSPVVVPRSRSSSMCMPAPSAAAASSVMYADVDPARCDVTIRCRVLKARLPPTIQPSQQPAEGPEAEEKDEEEGVMAVASGGALRPRPASLGQQQVERKEVSSDEEQEQELEAEAEPAASAAAGGKRKRAVSAAAAAATEDSGVEGHKRQAKCPAAADTASERSSSCSGASSSTTTAPIGLALPAPATKALPTTTTTPDHSVRVIMAVGSVLAAQSEYFARAFGGGWKESGARELSLTFEDEKEFEDFARLIRLCSGPSFLYEVEITAILADGCVECIHRELRREELLRLLLVADAFECLACVRDCTRHLCRSMTYALACKAFATVPESLKGHAHIRRLLVAAGRALALGVGVLGGARTWSRRRPDLSRGGKDKYVRFLPDLHPRLQALPPLALEFLLTSDALRVRSENDVFAFICAYLKGRRAPPHAWSKTQAQKVFNNMMPALRFHAMTGEFLTTVVSHSRWVLGSGRLLDVLRGALCFRDSRQHVQRYLAHQQQHHEEEEAAALAGAGGGGEQQQGQQEQEESDGEGEGGMGGQQGGAQARGRASAAAAAAREFAGRVEDEDDETYELKGTFSLAKCLNLPPGKFIRRYLGVVQGVPCFVDLERSVLDHNNTAAGGERESLGLFFGICNNLGSEPRTVGGSGALPVGSLVRYDISVKDCTRGPSVDVFANARQPWGFRDVLGLPWGDVVRQNSAYFDAQGRLEVRLRVRFLRDSTMPAAGAAFYEDDDSSDDDQEDEEEDEEDDEMGLMGGGDSSDEEEEEEDSYDNDDSDAEAGGEGLAQVIADAFAGVAAAAVAAADQGGDGEEEAMMPAGAGGNEDSEGSADA